MVVAGGRFGFLLLQSGFEGWFQQLELVDVSCVVLFFLVGGWVGGLLLAGTLQAGCSVGDVSRLDSCFYWSFVCFQSVGVRVLLCLGGLGWCEAGSLFVLPVRPLCLVR